MPYATGPIPASSNTTDSLSDLWSGFVDTLPELGAAAVVFVIFVGLGAVARRVIRRLTRSHSSANIGQVLGRLAQAGLLLLGLIVAVTIVAPSVGVSELFALLGIGSVAIGFAFRDILQNWLAGLLLLLREPFNAGDEIVFGDYEGVVEAIDTRATWLRTYDNRRVVIPNGKVYTESFVVNTAFENRRSEYEVGVAYRADIADVTPILLEAMAAVDNVLDDPAPDVIPIELGDSSVSLRARWWTVSQWATVIATKGAVIQEIKQRLDGAGVEIPFPQRVVTAAEPIRIDGETPADG